ncbi:MAG: triple tyrosine motif-containing protein, partial [Melioribacteraceae bacterium]|nr:triple tyrosine motif-containing protein [Melioribacteraceae bacterium]
MIRNKIFLLVTICFLNLEILSQNNINFDHLTTKDGLSNSAVTCIYQDKIGFMWFGTQDGLNRYDGYTFKIFKHNPDDTTSLSDNFIFSIYENESGILYFETQSGKLNQYDPLKETFKVVSKDDLDLYKFNMNSVLALLYDGPELVWSGGLSQPSGLVKKNKTKNDSTIFVNSPKNPSSLADDKVYSITKDSKGNYWIGTRNGLDKYDESSGEFKHYRNDPKNLSSLSDNWIWPVFEDSKGNLWIGTVQGGLNRFNYATESFQSYKYDPSNSNSINDNYIFSIYEDRSGLIWIGTNEGGINYFDPSLNVFEHFFNIPDNRNTLSDNSVLSICTDIDGNYWIGTRDGGLDKFNPKTKIFTNYSHNPSNPNSLLSNSIVSLYEATNGIIWIGNFSSGLNSYNPKTNEFKSYISSTTELNSLSDNRVYAILEDNEGKIWIGTYAGGLNSLDPVSGKIEIYRNDPNDSLSISSDNVWSLAKDNSGNLWAGTFGGGLNYFDKQTKSFKHFRYSEGKEEGLVDDNIIRIYFDSENTLWIGTTKGLTKYNGNNKFKNYSEKDGLTNNFVYGILEDENRNLWLSTNNGISKFNIEKEVFDNYFVEDGLQNNEFNQNAFAKDSKTGNLLFGGVNGFNIFNPSNMKGNSYVPQLAFTNFLRFNTDNEEGKPIFENGISVRNEINLSYKDNIIYFEFAALSFYNSFKNQYRYKLEGFNDNWIQLQNERDITFTNLSPGEYKLIISGSNNDGVWNDEGRTLLIKVLPPWWRTYYAYAAYLLLILGTLYSVRRFEINRREQKTLIREAELKMKATHAEKRVLEIENNRKTKELEEARQLQLSMLPKELPRNSNLDIAVYMKTATEVGGDYYDFSMKEDGSLNIALGDGTGHGLKAGILVS